jgi:hypothetical protein
MLEMRLAVSGISNDQQAEDASMKELIQAARRLESRYIDVVFTMGHGKGGLKKQGVLSLVRKALKMREGGVEISKLKVKAPDEGDTKSEELNFIDATVRSEFPIEMTPLIEEFFRRRKACVQQAWLDQRHKFT